MVSNIANLTVALRMLISRQSEFGVFFNSELKINLDM